MRRAYPALQVFAPAFILLAALSLYGVVRNPFTSEEAALLSRIRAEVTAVPDGWPYLLLLRVWSAPGEHPVWLRLSSTLCGLIALFLGQRVVRGLAGAHATSGAMLLLGGAPLMAAHSSRLSMAPAGLVALLACFACFLELARGGGRPWLVGWLIGILVACGMRAGFFWGVVVQWLVVLFYQERFRVPQRLWWLVQIPTALLLGWLHYPQMRGYLSGSRPVFLDTVQPADGAALVTRLSTALAVPAGLAGALLLTFLLGSGLWACRDWRRDARHGLLVSSLVVPCLIWLLVARSDAYLLMPLVCWCTLAAMGMRRFSRWVRQALWCGVAASYLWSYWHWLG